MVDKTIGRNLNTTDTAVSDIIGLSNTVAVTIQAANNDRIFFHVNNDNASHAFWLRLYPAAQDNIKQGIYISSKAGTTTSWEMPSDQIYRGEISAIAVTDSPDAYVTEY